MTPEELAAAEAPTVQLSMSAARSRWVDRLAVAVLGALAATGAAPAAWWLGTETAARQ